MRRRLLHARGGGVLRADSRRVAERLGDRRAGERDWTALPWASWSPRASSPRRWTSCARAAPRWAARPAAARGLAEWALDEGLYDEALRLSTTCWPTTPTSPRRWRCCTATTCPIRLPSAAEARPPSCCTSRARRAAGAARDGRRPHARRLPDQPALRAALLERLTDRCPATRATATLALRRLAVASRCGEAELQELLRRACATARPRCARGAALALRDAGQEGLIVPLVKALARLLHAARACGRGLGSWATRPRCRRS